jgi:hypothetical protein
MAVAAILSWRSSRSLSLSGPAFASMDTKRADQGLSLLNRLVRCLISGVGKVREWPSALW